VTTRSLLVNFPGYPAEPFGLVPDNGLAQLAAVLAEAGHRTVIEDFATVSTMESLFLHSAREEMERLSGRITDRVEAGGEPEARDFKALCALEDRIDAYQDGVIRELGRGVARKAAKMGVDFVGFKLWTGQGFSGAIAMAEEIRQQNPDVKIYGGGPHVDWFMEHAAAYAPVFDAMAYGEGEETVLALADHARGGRPLSSIPGIITRKGRTPMKPLPVDLDRLPFPRYDADTYPALASPGEKIRVLLVDESRGCPNRCNFCAHPIKSGKRRVMDPVKFVDRLEEMIRRYGTRYFRFAGSNPPALQRTRIAEEILARGLKVCFGAFAHVSSHMAEDYPLLRKAGCRVLSFGVESGSQKILDESINKGVKVEAIRRALLACKDAGISVVASLIVPAPFETDETKEETFRLIRECGPDSVMVHIPALILGTKWDRRREDFGFDLPDSAIFARRAMTHRVRIFGSPVLWRPLKWYKLNGKSLKTLGRETAAFMSRLVQEGLTVQIYDSVFLSAEAAGMTARNFWRVFENATRNGSIGEIKHLVKRVNVGLREDLEKPSPSYTV
jgi:hypothetical protein